MTAVYLDQMDSPLGTLLLAHAGDQLCGLDFASHEARFRTLLARRFGNLPLLERALPAVIADALRAYLGGVLDALREVPVHAAGSHFQQQVWQALRRIPAGEAWTYGELAEAVGRPGAARAVGLANAANPVAIVIPCHRVIGHDGQLTGYAGGLERKRWLLAHEGAQWQEARLTPLTAAETGGGTAGAWSRSNA